MIRSSGLSAPRCVSPLRSLLDFPRRETDAAIQHYLDYHDNDGMLLYSVFPNIRALLSTLKCHGVYVAVATSKPISRTMRLFKHYHLDHYFDCVIGEHNNEAQIGKAKLVERALPASYQRAVMVGDRKFDMEGAIANGIDSIGVRYGYSVGSELEDAGATYIAETTMDLFRMLCPGCTPPRGIFLSVEGMDGCGKTTQINLLAAKLKQYGYDVVQTREPGGCRISEAIRHLVLTTENMEMSAACEALLYAASRARSMCTR